MFEWFSIGQGSQLFAFLVSFSVGWTFLRPRYVASLTNVRYICTSFAQFCKLQCGWFALLLGQLFAQLLDCCLHNGLHCCLDCSLHCCWAVVRTIVCIVAGTKVCTIFLHCCWNCCLNNCLHNGCTVVVVLQHRRASCQGK